MPFQLHIDTRSAIICVYDVLEHQIEVNRDELQQAHGSLSVQEVAEKHRQAETEKRRLGAFESSGFVIQNMNRMYMIC